MDDANTVWYLGIFNGMPETMKTNLYLRPKSFFGDMASNWQFWLVLIIVIIATTVFTVFATILGYGALQKRFGKKETYSTVE